MVGVLILPSFYSCPGQECTGIFFRDQAQAVFRAGARVIVAYVEPRRLARFSWRSVRESHWQSIIAKEDGITTLRQKGWNPLLRTVAGGRVWSALLCRLVLNMCPEPDRLHVIHAHNALYAGLAARRLSRHLGIPYVVTEHASAFLTGNINPLEARIARQVYRDAAAVISVSSALARAITPYCHTQLPRVIPNVVDASYFSPGKVRHCDDRFQVFAGGNLTRNKGYDVLIRAFAAAFSGTPECRLTLMGDGPECASLKSLAFSLGIRDQVLFTGSVPRNMVREYMRAADVFVISSYHETFGVVAIEAIATGVPVIATRCGGPEDIVTSDTGWLVPPGAVNDMVDALQAARRSRPDIKTRREKFVARYSMSTVANQLLNLYRDVSIEV